MSDCKKCGAHYLQKCDCVFTPKDITSTLELKAENEKLKQENEQLKAQLRGYEKHSWRECKYLERIITNNNMEMRDERVRQ